MATRTLIELVDDLDGTPATQTVTFALDGITYDIDLSDANASQLRKTLATWAVHARRTSNRRTTRKRGSSPTPHTVDYSAIRSWAAEHGIAVPPRGRIARSVIDAYNAAH